MPIPRAQSAMEYLTTYGWAILAITVAFAALYSFGIFDMNTYSTGALPGSCQVYRPYGPGTQQLVTLQGVCNSEKPKSVAYFNGASSYISTGTAGLPLGSSPRSVFAWVYFNSNGPDLGLYYIYGYGTTSNNEESGFTCWPANCNNILFTGWNNDFRTGNVLTPNTWHFVGYTYGGGTSVTVYYDGISQTSALSGGTQLNTVLPGSDPADIGKQPNGGPANFQGEMADVQVYNISLSANAVRELYLEGIGGPPVTVPNIVGWWPLNGDVYDYSGNRNNGVANAITFSTSWSKTYTVGGK